MAIPNFRDHYYLDDITKKSLSFLECFDELEAVAIMLGFKPSFGTELFNNEYDWFVAPVKQLRKDVEYGRLTNSNYTTEQGYGFGIVDIYQVNALDMKEWANFYGYDWEVPEYKPFKPQQNKLSKNDEPLLQNTTSQDQITELQAQLQEKNARIAELEQELQNLKKTEEQNQKIVNYDKCSIYGHSSEGIEVIFKMSKTIAETCDPDNPHSYPSKSQIIDEVKRTYSDSNELATAIYQVITSDKVKKRGRPPKDIDTFKGFR